MNKDNFDKILSDNETKVLISNEETERIESISNLTSEFYEEKNDRVKEDTGLKTRVSQIEKNAQALEDILSKSFNIGDNKNFQLQQQIVFNTDEINDLMKELKEDIKHIKNEDIDIIKDDVKKIFNNISNLTGFSGNSNSNSNVSDITNSINELKNLIQNMNVSVDNSFVINEISKVDSNVKNNTFILNQINSNVRNLSIKSGDQNSGSTQVVDNTNTINRIDSNVEDIKTGIISNVNTATINRIDSNILDIKRNSGTGNVVDNTAIINRIDSNILDIKRSSGTGTVVDNTATINKISTSVENIKNDTQNLSKISFDINEIKNNNTSISSIKDDTNTLKNSISFLQNLVEDLTNKVENIQVVNAGPSNDNNTDSNEQSNNDIIDGKTFTPNPSLPELLDIVFFLPIAEVGTPQEDVLLDAISFGSNYNINIINVNDYAITKENFADKFLFYYNKGARFFISKMWSSRLSVLNEFFNNIEQTNPELDMNSFIYLDIGSTAPNLVNSDGSIATRNKYITRMVPNDIVAGEIILRKFREEIVDYDELVITYVDDPYGSYFFDVLSLECEENNIPYKVFKSESLSESIKYMNESTKDLICVNVLFTENIIKLFKNISSPFLKTSKMKFIFTETVAFNSAIINTPDFLIKYSRYEAEFYQYVGANSSISFIKNNLNVNLEGSSNTYSMIDGLNLIGNTKNLVQKTGSEARYETLKEIINTYYGFSGNTQIDEKTNDRATMMYNFTFLKINTILDDDPRNDPFPYIISQMYQEDNRLIKISQVDTNQDLEKTFKSGIFLFSNFFIMSMLMSPKHVQRNNTLSSTYGLGNIIKVQNIAVDEEDGEVVLRQLNLGFGEDSGGNNSSGGLGSSTGNNADNLQVNLDLISSSANNTVLLDNLKQQLNILFLALNRQFLKWSGYILPSLMVFYINGDDSFLKQVFYVNDRIAGYYQQLSAYFETNQTQPFLNNIKSSKITSGKLNFSILNDLLQTSNHATGFFATLDFVTDYNPDTQKQQFTDFKNEIYKDLVNIRNALDVNNDNSIPEDIKNLGGIQSEFSTAISIAFLGVVDSKIAQDQLNAEFILWVGKYTSLTNIFSGKNPSVAYAYFYSYLRALDYKNQTGISSINDAPADLLFLTKLGCENFSRFLR